ncbi:MAG: hypothetical protein P8175_19295, partial [Deltaproteobacteria bacterium]
RLVSVFSGLVVKLALFVIILALGPLAYFFISMEKEGSIQKAIDQSQAYIQTQRQALSSLEQEREQLAKEIDALRSQEDELNRQEKIDIMELNVKLHSMDQKRQAIEVDITSHENEIAENLERIKEVKKKPFLKRLLKR